MARMRKYKRLENELVRRIEKVASVVWKKIVKVSVNFVRAGQKKLTIMVVPHSQKKVASFQTSFFALSFGCILLAGIIISFFWFTGESVSSSRRVLALQEEVAQAQASLHAAQKETAELVKIGKNFQSRLSATILALGLDSGVNDAGAESSTTGDLANLFGTHGADGQGVSDVQQLASYLGNSIQAVDEMGRLLESQTALFSNIPSLWPIKGGLGYISFPFGQNRHPITGRWYIHQGIDLSTRRSGDPVVATADGQVVTVEYDSGWGNYIILKHKHGFYTRYAHLQSYRVVRGQHVQQGEVIGYIGNTGISTAAHLHYEVHIGADVVDPLKYLNIKSAIKN